MSLLHALHVVANLVWIGSILAVALVLSYGAGDAKTRGETALMLYRRLSTPGFVLAFLLGVIVLASNATYYLRTSHYMHPKLLLALGVIGLHHVIGARAKKLAAGTSQDIGPVPVLALVLLVLAAGAAILAVLKPF